MTIQKIPSGSNDDGTPHYHYYCPDGHVVLTGRDNAGVRELADGTAYDVTEPAIEVQSHEHALELADLLSPGSDVKLSKKGKGH